MNPQERNELRMIHVRIDYRDGVDFPKCGYCNNGSWPCDVILVLNAWEASL